MNKILTITAALVLATSSPAIAQDAASVLASAQQAMGLSGATSLTITANGSLKDTGEAAGGNAPVPVVAEYIQDLDLTTPGMRLRIHRTNPDGTALVYGGTELQFVSGNSAWQVFTTSSVVFPNAPPDTAPPPKPEDTFDKAAKPIALTGTLVQARQTQIALTPAGFIALASMNEATVAAEGDSQVVSFSTAGGQSFAGTFGGDGLLTEVSTADPLSGEALTVSFSGYQQFGAVTYPSTIVEVEGDVTIANLTVTAVSAGPIPEISVPESVANYTGP